MINRNLYQKAPEYCHYYFNLVESEDLNQELEKSRKLTLDLFGSIQPEKENYAYSSNKWTVKEVFKHIIDCERVYAYRALRFSRFDPTDLPGFDENKYMENFRKTNYKIADLISEFDHVRKSTIALFKDLTDDMLDFEGTANNLHFTARTLGFVTVGHNLHHCNMITSLYLD